MDNLREKLEGFRLAKYRFVLQPNEFIKLNTYAGSSLRRAFIPVFKQITCLNLEAECEQCEKKEECAYFRTMEEPVNHEDPAYKRYQTPPKPFIFEPPLKRRTFYSHNDELTFDLILFGNALEFFPFFAAAIRRLGELGIGRNQGKFTLKRILAFDLLKNSVVGEYAFDSAEASFDKDISVSLSQLLDKYEREYQEISQITVSIVTPLRMKRLGSENWHLYFRTLIRSVLVRLANLAYSYCGYDEFLEFPDIIYRAGRVRTVKENFIWEDWRPPNQRMNDNVRLGGFVGDIIYQGPITEFWPVLRLGEVLHVGKNTSFGLGRILVEPDEATSKTRVF